MSHDKTQHLHHFGCRSFTHLYVHHIVLNYRLWFVHCRTIKDQIAWPHLIEFKVDRAGVVLVALITASKFETKVFLKVVNGSPNESTTVKEERWVIQGVIWLAISFCVRHPEILFTLANELLSEPVFELFWSVSFVVEGFSWNSYWLYKFLFFAYPCILWINCSHTFIEIGIFFLLSLIFSVIGWCAGFLWGWPLWRFIELFLLVTSAAWLLTVWRCGLDHFNIKFTQLLTDLK